MWRIQPSHECRALSGEVRERLTSTPEPGIRRVRALKQVLRVEGSAVLVHRTRRRREGQFWFLHVFEELDDLVVVNVAFRTVPGGTGYYQGDAAAASLGEFQSLLLLVRQREPHHFLTQLGRSRLDRDD